MKSISKVVSILVLAAVSNSAQAGSLKLDTDTALKNLRDAFSNAGYALNIDAPLINGMTAKGEVCTVDVKLLAQLKGDINMGTVMLSVGERGQDGFKEVVFDLSPKTSEANIGSYDVRQQKTPDNVLSLSETEDHTVQVQQLIGNGVTEDQVPWHRSIEITKDSDDKITSVHITNKDENGDETCNLN